jgi:hypothetical protein
MLLWFRSRNGKTIEEICFEQVFSNENVMLYPKAIPVFAVKRKEIIGPHTTE